MEWNGMRGGGVGARRAVLVTALWVVAGCSGDGTGLPEVVPAELAGVWVAAPGCMPQCGFTLESAANPADTLNITAFTGITTEVSMTRSGSFLMRTRPGPDTVPAGQVRVAGNLLIVTDVAGTVDTVEYAVADNFLQLRFRRQFRIFDFNGDGENDPAYARGRFRRQ